MLTLIKTPVRLMVVLLAILFLSVNAQKGQVKSTYSDSSLMSDLLLLKNHHSVSSEFLASVAFLWTGRDVTGNIYPGNAVVDKPGKQDAYTLFGKVPITLFKGASYNVGDTVDIVHSLKLLSFKGNVANCIKPVGRAVVTEIDGKKIKVLLVKMWDVISGGDRVMPMRSFKPFTPDSVVDPIKAIEAKVVITVETVEVPYLYQTFIIDRGSVDGVGVGDIFDVYPKSGDEKTGPSVSGLVVNLNEKSSTLTIIRVSSIEFRTGDNAYLVRTTVSK